MGNYYALKSKWEKLVQQGKSGRNFNSSRLAPGSFCMHISDAGGASMSCYSQVELTGYFDNANSALAFIRFVQIPRILDMEVGTNKGLFEVADAYLLRCAPDQMGRVDRLLGLIDRALIAGVVSPKELALIRVEFNATFCDTNPMIEILAWGNVVETLESDYFTEKFSDDLADESEEDEKPSVVLKGLLDSGSFNEKNSEHLSLTKNFFERHMSA